MDITAASLKVFPCSCTSKKFISKIRRIAVETIGGAHFISGFMNGFNDGGNDRKRDITDAEPDDLGIRMGIGICCYFF